MNPELMLRLAARLSDGITTGHDWPNTDDELLRLQCARMMKDAVGASRIEVAADQEPVAWRYRGTGWDNWILTDSDPKLSPLADEINPLYCRRAADTESRRMFVARLETINKNELLSVNAVLALLNDCDRLASRAAPALAVPEPAPAAADTIRAPGEKP